MKNEGADRSDVVKSVSLKDFSIKETMQKYENSASGKLREGKLDEVELTKRRPSLVNSLSLKDFSLKETLAIYQSNSSKSLGASKDRVNIDDGE